MPEVEDRRCGVWIGVVDERSEVVAGVLGVLYTCLHYIASLTLLYDSLNVMKAVGRLILSV